jgi:putative ABC transport system ATP-binding protein
MENIIIEFKNVTKSFSVGNQKIEALKNINLNIHKKDFLAITGPSGSGKSTLLNLMSFIDEPTSGHIYFDEIEIEKYNDKSKTLFRNQKIGIIFQSFNLIPVLTSIENVALPIQIHSKKNKEIVEMSKDLLNELGLGNHLNHYPNSLSGGQKQRVAIARALITNPEIIIADEPTSALDSKTGIAIIELMKKINQEKGTSFIFSTHDQRIMNEVERKVELIDGRINN